MTPHVVPQRTYLTVFAALIALTATTVAMSFVELGPWHVGVALLIATAKMVLVVLFFMHLLHSIRLIWLVVAAAVVWLLILFGLTFADYDTRDWIKRGVSGLSPERLMKSEARCRLEDNCDL